LLEKKKMQDLLKEELKKYFPKAKIYLFGSRARGDNSFYSDFDIALESDEDLGGKIAEFKYFLEESNIPYKVDIVELKKAPYLKEVIEKEGILWS